MTAKPILQPGPDHPITVDPTSARVIVSFEGQVIADTRNARTLREASYPPVQYLPLTDVDESFLQPTDNASYCPYKGDAGYYSIRVGEHESVNTVWTYHDPYAPVAEIKDHVAFYADRVDIRTEQD